MQKLIKDVVHGYIAFDERYIKIINSPEFQRLKNIRQTSYNSLYPSSSHDRFTHSIGVYQLGKIAFENFKENVSGENGDYKGENISIDFWQKTKEIFLLACLLHDIGHSPFSHTGEYFYLRKRSETQTVYIYDELPKIVNKSDFTIQFRDSVTANNVAKPHEIMSAIIGIKKWLSKNSPEEKELFARMIIGLQYNNKNDIQIGIYNALIYLLNSNVIDVDKLDYLLRDQMMTGYKGVGIDTERLLSSVCLVNQSLSSKKNYHLGYYKNALSVIENVVIAHDAEKKWIQTHAVVSYDSFLVQRCIKAIESCFCNNAESSVFCEEALSVEGLNINNNLIRLLCDADIIFLAKQVWKDHLQREYIDEFFDRSIRKKAIWKSESEFDLMLREVGDDDRRIFVNWMEELIAELTTGVNSFEHSIVVNSHMRTKAETEFHRKEYDYTLPETEKESAFETFQSVKKKFDIFDKFSTNNKIDFNFVITWNKRFGSNVDKFQDNEILIKYKDYERAKAIGEIISTYCLNKQSAISKVNNVYYVYYNRPVDNEIFPAKFIKEFVELIKHS